MGEATFVKFHWMPMQGLQSVLWNEVVRINGADPDFHRRDLWDAIQAGDPLSWELDIQVFDEAFADEFELAVDQTPDVTATEEADTTTSRQ